MKPGPYKYTKKNVTPKVKAKPERKNYQEILLFFMKERKSNIKGVLFYSINGFTFS